MSKQQSESKSATQQSTPPSILAWTIRIVSFLMVASLIVFFVYNAFNANKKPVFSIKKIENKTYTQNGQVHLAVQTTNDGDSGVIQVVIEANYKDYNSTQIIAILGPHESVTSIFVLAPNIPPDSVEIVPLSFVSP